jgi:hypothetical protein
MPQRGQRCQAKTVGDGRGRRVPGPRAGHGGLRPVPEIPAASQEAIEAVVQAYTDVGLRMVVAPPDFRPGPSASPLPDESTGLPAVVEQGEQGSKAAPLEAIWA